MNAILCEFITKSFGVILFLILTGGHLNGQDTFMVFRASVDIPERGLVPSYVLKIAEHEYSLIPPVGWRVYLEDQGKKIILKSTDYKARIILSLDPEIKMDVEPEVLRTAILDRFVDSKILREYDCYTSSSQGKAFDIEQSTVGRVKLLRRLALIECKETVFIVELMCSKKDSKEFDNVFGNLLTSLRIKHPKSEVSSPPLTP